MMVSITVIAVSIISIMTCLSKKVVKFSWIKCLSIHEKVVRNFRLKKGNWIEKKKEFIQFYLLDHYNCFHHDHDRDSRFDGHDRDFGDGDLRVHSVNNKQKF